ncbi:NFACT RNA binding domain-containing protein [Acidithiobacillus sp.]|uniref:NFACT RNA binding domain-containing protein n=1 Tax=Acidithiobacillus sp. TaxID=1872118 RepID=UPI002604A52F|nr:NFACT RNA binding domain-containing protein [Acidithiobacillus sp.]MDD5279723.1 NFACT RNA binding domain-containing protein [Acidithiobacillus sp.]
MPDGFAAPLGSRKRPRSRPLNSLSMDTLQLAAAAQFFQQQLAGQSIHKISAAAGGLHLHTGKQTLACMVQRTPLGLWLAPESAAPEEQQGHWSNLLQQRLKGFRIERIAVPWADRIVRLDFSRIHISKRVDQLSLIAECFGGRGNLALLDAQEQIRWAWRWDSLDGPAVPRFLPGIVYHPPESARPFEESRSDPTIWLQCMAPRYRPGSPATQAFIQEQWAARSATSSWWQAKTEAGQNLLYPLRLPDGPPMQALSPDVALQLPASPLTQAPSPAEHALAIEKNRLHQRIQKMRHDLQQWEAPEYYRILAFALFAVPDAIARVASIQATDHTHGDGRILEIAVTPGKSLHQQAQKYMQKALRSQRAVQKIQQRLQDSEKLLDELLSRGQEALLLTQRLPQTQNAPVRHKDQERSARGLAEPFHHTMIAGFDIFWGNNARENDRLTFRFAKDWDIWFHVQDLGGSHVILRRENASTLVPEQVIAAAARLALQHSQSRAFSAEVDWTEVRHVQRKPGAGPGQVIYRHFQTIRVRRDAHDDL